MSESDIDSSHGRPGVARFVSWSRAVMHAALVILATQGTVGGYAPPSWAIDLGVDRPTAPRLLAPPDIFGPGKVLDAGRVFMKVTNHGFVGNPFPNLSSDPSGQWPRPSGVEYLNSIRLAVGAATPFAYPYHRVSYFTEWGPATSGPEDIIYTTSDKAINGARYVNDDNDYDVVTGEPRIDEDFLDGRDNDGDGLIDEDFGALGQKMFSCVIRDDGPYSTNTGETHVPIGLEVRQKAWAYTAGQHADFDAVEFTVFNRSDAVIDSVYVGFGVDLDVGPLDQPTFFSDDRSLGGYPSGEYVRALEPGDPERQFPHDPSIAMPPDSALCPRVAVRVNGFSVVDNDGDGDLTPGTATFLLLDHTVDPLGLTAPSRVGFRAFRAFPNGTPWALGGSPSSDSLRWVFLSSTENVDPATGFITTAGSTQSADWGAWCSVGPFPQMAPGASVSVTVAFAVQTGSFAEASTFLDDYAAYRAGMLDGAALLVAHPPLANAYATQVFHDGVHTGRQGFPVPDFHGRETRVILPPGAPSIFLQDCRDKAPRLVTDREPTWFDFDCDYCTGVWDYTNRRGLFHETWTEASQPVAVPELEPPAALALEARPSPTRGATQVGFTLPVAGEARITIHDVSGRLVRELAAGRFAAGRHELSWNGADLAGRPAASGIYVVDLATGGRHATRKLVLIR